MERLLLGQTTLIGKKQRLITNVLARFTICRAWFLEQALGQQRGWQHPLPRFLQGQAFRQPDLLEAAQPLVRSLVALWFGHYEIKG